VNSPRPPALRSIAVAMGSFILLSTIFSRCGAAQESSPGASGDANVRELASEVRELRAMMEQMRAENAQSRADMQELRQELQNTRKMLAPVAAAINNSPSAQEATAESATAVASSASSQTMPSTMPQTAPNSATVTDLSNRVQTLEDSTQLMASKINEQYQTKVEAASKYRVRLSGIVLMNAFRNVGASDNLDLPDYAVPPLLGTTSQASLGATLRQSEIGLQAFGPTIAGANTSANVQLDFAGGFPATSNGVNFGIARLQTASVRFDWKNTSVIAGQDSLFVSPVSPTSFASLATPALAYSGNLWGWTPQVRLEHRFELANQQTLTVQGGILDNLDWQNPMNSNSYTYTRSAQAGEATGQPAYAARTAWSTLAFGHPLTIGAAGYYGRQSWTWGHNVDGWAGMTDWQIPIVRRLTLSGEFYRGRAAGGLGGGIGQTIVYGGDPRLPTTPIRGIDSAGGWTQLKLQITPKLEMNGAFGEDNAFTGNIRGFAIDADNFGEILGRNHGEFGNLIYRPRSNLLLAAEFRRLHTFPIYDAPSITNQINLSLGILF